MSGDSPFSQPSSGGDKFEPKAFGPGALLLIYPKSYSGASGTKFGDTTSADVDVIVVDRVDPETGKPHYFHNARLFGNLANSVRDDLGGCVLGRLGQGVNTKGNPPWILLEYSPADAQLAGPVHQQYQANLFKPKEDPGPGGPAQAQPDPYAAYTASPPPPPYVPAQAPPAAPAPAATPDAENISKLIRNGVDRAVVAAMDPLGRAQLASTYP